MDRLYLVVPCYNEEEVLPETVRRLTDKLRRMEEKGLVSGDSRILLVDDGSRDRTWELICGFHRENPVVSGLKLSRNRGHQNALVAGLMTARELCDITISLDADLQDDIEVLDQFVEAYHKGAQIVYGVRSARDTDTAFKRSTAMGFFQSVYAIGIMAGPSVMGTLIDWFRITPAFSIVGVVCVLTAAAYPLISRFMRRAA